MDGIFGEIKESAEVDRLKKQNKPYKVYETKPICRGLVMPLQAVKLGKLGDGF